MMKKIVFVITGFTKWWAERQLFNLISWIKNEYNIEIIWFFDWYYKNEFEKLWLKVHLIEMKSNIWIFKAIYSVNKIMKSINPDIIQSMLPHANIVSKFVNWINFKKYKLYTWVRNSRDTPLLWFLEKLTNPFSNLIITNSNTNKKALVKRWFKDEKVKVIYNWVSFTEAKEIYKYDKKNIITVAKFFNQKDYETNVLVAEQLSKIRNDFKFNYVWNWPELEKIKKMVKDKKLEEYIEFLWVKNDIPELLSSCDIFFLPTKFEWQANVILESMFYWTTIVTTNIPENLEICEAFFTDVWNINDMTKVINSILDKKVDFSDKRDKNSKSIKEFSVEKMLGNYMEVYNKN